MRATVVVLLAVVACASPSIIDILEYTNGHDPRVAVYCGKIPFHADLETGSWVADSSADALCDADKEDVLKYCKKVYPNLNISNIVEANHGVTFNNWCQPGLDKCDVAGKVTPYRCLVNEYEADALMVPDGCKFDHLHDPSKCLSHHDWHKQAKRECKVKHGDMKLRDYGILLSCGTDMFSGVEYVCCPRKHDHKKHEAKKPETLDTEDFQAAVKKFKSYLPKETQGCDRSNYLNKQTALEEHHRKQIAVVVDEWDEAERRYNQLKKKDDNAAEEKMKRTLEVFRQTLAALEEESKSSKNRLREEHAECINTQISKDKRDAMFAYLGAVEAKPADADQILATVRKFIQVCEHDRVHSLRHFEHVRNRDEDKAETLRGELLQHLKDLNKVVNESMALLNYLPEIAEKFGITGGAVLTPKKATPTEEPHLHERVKEILKEAPKKYNTKGDAVPEKTQYEETELEVKPVKTTSTPENNKEVAADYDFSDENEREDEEEREVENEKLDEENEKLLKRLLRKESEDLEREERIKKMMEELPPKEEGDDKEDEEFNRAQQEIEKEKHQHKKERSVALTAVLGLSCGVVVIMMFVVIAMILRRHRSARIVVTENNDDREHLVELQKNGFENPTYKFFYY